MTGALRRILVIEDDAETATQVVSFLTTHGYEADLAVNGREGLRLGETAQYAVITIDRMLPVMDGLAIIRRLREAGVTTPALGPAPRLMSPAVVRAPSAAAVMVPAV